MSASILGLLVVVAAVISASVGPFDIPLTHVASSLLSRVGISAGTHTRTESLVIEQLRLPRVCIAVLVGAALAVSGTTMQAIFRNPLADPGIAGVSAGAAAGAVIAIAAGASAGTVLALPAFAFAGALLAVLAVYGIAIAGGRLNVAALLLAGVAVSSFLGAVIATIIAYVPDDQGLRSIIFWLAGSLSGASWLYVRVIAIPILAGILVAWAFARDLNLMILGDDLARTSGVNVSRTRTLLIFVTALATGAAVSVSGTIGFIGLVVPHVMRIIVGPDHRILIPASALAGALFLLVADTIARVVVKPAELQVGMITAFVGAPLFVFLLLRNARGIENI